jgi:archaellin
MTLGTFCWPTSMTNRGGGVWHRFMMTALAISLISLGSATIEAQQTSPSLEETSQWLKQAFIDYGRVTTLGINSSVNAAVSSIDITGCHVTVTVNSSLNDQVYSTQTDQFLFGSLDPESLVSSRHSNSSPGVNDFWTAITLHSTNATAQINETYPNNDGSKSSTVNSVQWIMHMEDPFTSRLSLALKHAIILCGGKSSIF